MSVYRDMAHDAGYRGDEADEMAAALEHQEREAYEQWSGAQQAEAEAAVEAQGLAEYEADQAEAGF